MLDRAMPSAAPSRPACLPGCTDLHADPGVRECTTIVGLTLGRYGSDVVSSGVQWAAEGHSAGRIPEVSSGFTEGPDGWTERFARIDVPGGVVELRPDALAAHIDDLTALHSLLVRD